MKTPDTGAQPPQLPRQLCLWLLGVNKWTPDSACRWGIFIQQQGCLRATLSSNRGSNCFVSDPAARALQGGVGGRDDRGGGDPQSLDGGGCCEGSGRGWGTVSRVGSGHPGHLSCSQYRQHSRTARSHQQRWSLGRGENWSAEPEPETSVVQGATDQAAREGLLLRGLEAGAWHPSHRLRARKFRSVSSLGSSPRFCPPSSAWASHLNSVPEFSCLLDCVSLTEGL